MVTLMEASVAYDHLKFLFKVTTQRHRGSSFFKTFFFTYLDLLYLNSCTSYPHHIVRFLILIHQISDTWHLLLALVIESWHSARTDSMEACESGAMAKENTEVHV